MLPSQKNNTRRTQKIKNQTTTKREGEGKEDRQWRRRPKPSAWKDEARKWRTFFFFLSLSLLCSPVNKLHKENTENEETNKHTHVFGYLCYSPRALLSSFTHQQDTIRKWWCSFFFGSLSLLPLLSDWPTCPRAHALHRGPQRDVVRNTNLLSTSSSITLSLSAVLPSFPLIDCCQTAQALHGAESGTMKSDVLLWYFLLLSLLFLFSLYLRLFFKASLWSVDWPARQLSPAHSRNRDDESNKISWSCLLWGPSSSSSFFLLSFSLFSDLLALSALFLADPPDSSCPAHSRNPDDKNKKFRGGDGVGHS